MECECESTTPVVSIRVGRSQLKMEISSTLVASHFVKKYYQILATDPSELHRFYGEDSSFCHTESPSEASVIVTGTDNIRKRVTELNLLNAHVDITEGGYDVMESFSFVAAIFLVVTGHFSVKNSQPSAFTQSFVLAKPENNPSEPYYVKHSIFRFSASISTSLLAAGAGALDGVVSAGAQDAMPPVVVEAEVQAPVTSVSVNVATTPAVAKEEVAAPVPTPVPVPAPVVVEQTQPPPASVPAAVAAIAVVAPFVAAVEESAPVPAKKESVPKPLSFLAAAKSGVNSAAVADFGVIPAAPRVKVGAASTKVATTSPTTTTVKNKDIHESGGNTSGNNQSGNGHSTRGKHAGSASTAGTASFNDNTHNSMYIKQLTTKVTDTALKETFSKYGTITRCDVQAIKGFAFIDFSTRASLLAALSQTDPVVVCGVTLRLEERAPKGPQGEKSKNNNNSSASGDKNAGGRVGNGGAHAGAGGKGSSSNTSGTTKSNAKASAGGGGSSGGGGGNEGGGDKKDNGEKKRNDKKSGTGEDNKGSSGSSADK